MKDTIPSSTVKEFVAKGREATEINLKNTIFKAVGENELLMVLNKMIDSYYVLGQFNNFSIPHKLLNCEAMESRVKVVDYLWNRLLISKGVSDYQGLNLGERDLAVLSQYKDTLSQFSKAIHSINKSNAVIEYYINELCIHDQVVTTIEVPSILGITDNDSLSDLL